MELLFSYTVIMGHWKIDAGRVQEIGVRAMCTVTKGEFLYHIFNGMQVSGKEYPLLIHLTRSLELNAWRNITLALTLSLGL